jgi:hypothetical protein
VSGEYSFPFATDRLLQAVEQHRREYERARMPLLAASPSHIPSAARHAFLAHRVLSAVEAAERRDRAALGYFRGPASALDLAASAVRTPCGSMVVVRSWDGTCAGHPLYGDMPALPLASLPPHLPSPLLQLALAATAICSDVGFGELLLSACAVIVLLRRRGLDEATSSWTTTALPCTVFCDYHGDPVLLGADLVHETMHSLLNEILTSRGVELSLSSRYYSPWKGRVRPAFGFLHSIVAFSVMVCYLRAAADRLTSPAAEEYSRQREQLERDRLRGTARSVRMLLEQELSGQPDLVEAVERCYATAVG